MNRPYLKLLLGLLLLSSTMAGCGGGGATQTPVFIVVTPTPVQPEAVTVASTTAPEPATAKPTEPAPAAEVTPSTPDAAGIQILEATFAHGLGEEMQPEDPGNDFQADETIYLSLKIKGRPKQGLVTARFYWRDALIAEADVDLADANSAVLFSVGENTYAGYTLSHEEPFPLGDKYRADVFYGDQFLGSHLFRVVAPLDAIASQVAQVVLAQGASEDYTAIEPTTTFSFEDTVHLVGRGDLGLSTWLQADWFVNGQWDETGTRSLSLEENAPDVGFAFSYQPEGGWPPGDHFVILTMNDQEVGRYPFSVLSPDGTIPLDEAAFWDAFPLPDDAEMVEVGEGFDLGFTTAMIEPEVFDAYAAWLRDQDWQQQAPTEAQVTLPHQVWRHGGAEFLIEIRGLDEQERTIVWLQLAPWQ